MMLADKYSKRPFRKRGIKIGTGTFIDPSVQIRDKRTVIGKYCSIAKYSAIGTGTHPLNALTTNSMVDRPLYDEDGFLGVDPENRVEFEHTRPVTVGNDVWIGRNAVIMDGITIGDGAVIGSSAVVTKDIPPYAIAAGVPASIIRYRFDEITIERLLKSRWYDRDREFIRTLPVGNVPKCLELLESAEQR